MAEELYNQQQDQREEQDNGAVEATSATPVNTGIQDYDQSGQGSVDGEGKGVNAADASIMPDNIAQLNQASVAAKALAYNPATVFVPQVGPEEVEEHLTAMFDGQELTEDFRKKASTIFESAINSKITDLSHQLDESYRNVLTEQVEQVIVNLSEKVDEYLNYVIDEWMEKNELAVERGIKSDVAESFISGLKSLFEAHYVNVPDEKYDILDDLFDTNEKLQESLNEQIETNIQMNTQLNEGTRQQIFNYYAQDLADTEREKFVSLAESVSYDDAESFTDKLSQIKESYFTNSVITKEPEELIEQTTNPRISNGTAMDGYVDSLAFHMRNQNKQKP
jgi:hypothetical protein